MNSGLYDNMYLLMERMNCKEDFKQLLSRFEFGLSRRAAEDNVKIATIETAMAWSWLVAERAMRDFVSVDDALSDELYKDVDYDD